MRMRERARVQPAADSVLSPSGATAHTTSASHSFLSSFLPPFLPFLRPHFIQIAIYPPP